MFTDVSEVLAASIIKVIVLTRGMGASGTSLNFFQSARRNIAEDCFNTAI
jgi:hypothetical protein